VLVVEGCGEVRSGIVYLSVKKRRLEVREAVGTAVLHI